MREKGYSALADLVLAAVQQNGGLDLNPNNSGRRGVSSNGEGSRGTSTGGVWPGIFYMLRPASAVE